MPDPGEIAIIAHRLAKKERPAPSQSATLLAMPASRNSSAVKPTNACHTNPNILMKRIAPLLFLMIALTVPVHAANLSIEQRVAQLESSQSGINTGDNAWVLVSTALVLMMTAPGLALFYGGLVRRKNVLATMMHSMFLMALISLLWAVFGYSMAFGDGNALVGSPLQHFLLKGVGAAPNASYAATIPQQSFMLFQLMFAIITPALISGAFAERIRISQLCHVHGAVGLLVYFPLAHMVWGNGGFFNWALGGKIPVLDFAGGTVVHISSGVSALVCAVVFGKRAGYPHEPMLPIMSC